MILRRLVALLWIFMVISGSLRGADVQGKVLDEFGKGLADVSVVVTNLDSGEKLRCATGPLGDFALGLPDGDYSVALEGIPADIVESGVLNDLHLVVTEQTTAVTFKIQLQEKGQKRLVLQSPGQPAEVPPELDPDLAAIRDFEIRLVPPVATTAAAVFDLESTLNPFPAGKRGRLHGSVYEFHRNDNLDARNFFDPVGEPLPEYKRNQFGFSLAVSLNAKIQVLGSYDGLRIVQGSTLLSHLPTAAMKVGDFGSLLSVDGVQLRDPLSGEVFQNNRLPDSRIHPVARRLLVLLADPNRTDADRNYVNNQPVVHNQDSFSQKVDYQFADQSKLSIDYSRTSGEAVRVHPLPAFVADEQFGSQDLRLYMNRSFSKRVSVDGTLRLMRSRNERLSRNSGQSGLINSLGISGLNVSDPVDEGYPEFSLSGYAGFGDSSSPVTSTFNGLFPDVTLSYALEAHTLRLGADFDMRQYNNYRFGGSHRGRFVFNGYYTGDAFADFLLGMPEVASRAVGSDRSDLRGSNWLFFFRDSWKVTPRLTASFSLNYSVYPPYASARANVSGFAPLLFEPSPAGDLVVAGSAEAISQGLPDDSGSMVLTDWNNWAPRFGFSYNPFGTSRLVIRASYGISYESAAPGYFLNYLGHNYPFYWSEVAQSPVEEPLIDLSDPFRAAAPAELSVRGIDPHLRSPYYQGWDLSLQSELFRDWSFEASYDGNKGTRMIRVIPGNVPLPGTGDYQPRRPNQELGRFTLVTNSGSYTEHALDLGAERRFSGGFSIDSGFRVGRSFSDSFSNLPSNPRNLRAEKAPAGWSPTRVFSLRYIVDLPFGRGRPLASDLGDSWIRWIVDGWRLTGITRIQNGDRFSVLMAGDTNNDGLSGERPDRIGSGRLNPAERSIDRWFATEHFTAPGAYSFGNAGRNILEGPGYQNWDVSIVKQTRFADGDAVELRVEFFNAFNKVNFDDPVAVLDTSTYGKIFGAGRAREIEVALKYSF